MGGVYELYDASGKLVYNAEIRNLKTGIGQDIAPGIYLLRMVLEQKACTFKLVKL